MATKYNIGDPVWAKMKGFSPWPGKVANPTKEVKRPALKKPMHCIFFFGTNNYAWIQEDQIKPYEASKEQFSKSSKTASFKEALEAIEDYVKNLPEQPVRSSDLPSIDEEISTIFPNGSVSPITNTPTKGSPSARVAASEDEVEEAPATPAVTPSKAPQKHQRNLRNLYD
ncbi:putative oxidoreductase GLYR1 homolog [Rhipicephalus sanguineus]|uniref:putative oxidoreductase GLYR1 homolog n=1 Tax=Rhipicephalus sanguineus TaxID=34632 RepID=UPI001895EF2F|nr:putative oxidoreductase GLYR1 homolog [Rhipicephalus sanguineus]